MTNRFLIGLMALAFCFIIVLPAYAQDPPTTEEKGRPPRFVVRTPPPAQDAITPEKKALIKELMNLMTTSTNSEALIDQFLEQGLKQSAPMISQELLRNIPQEKLSSDEQRRLKSEADEATQRIIVRIRAEFPKRVNMGEIFDRVGVEIYAKRFSDEEIKELLVLYKSPVAQKFLRLLPEITAEMFPKVEKWVTPSLTKLMDEVFIEEKKKFKTR